AARLGVGRTSGGIASGFGLGLTAVANIVVSATALTVVFSMSRAAGATVVVTGTTMAAGPYATDVTISVSIPITVPCLAVRLIAELVLRLQWSGRRRDIVQVGKQRRILGDS